MRLLWICISILLVPVLVVRAQLVLNPGDVWTYSFSTLPFTGTQIPFGAGTSYGTLEMEFSSFENGGTLRYEMFEGEPTGSAFRSGLITSELIYRGTLFATTDYYVWQDLNGSARLTMLTGACTVVSVRFRVGKPYPQNPINRVDTYSALSSLTSPPPRLVVERLSNAVQVSWWTNGSTGFVLEATNALDSGAWPPLATPPSVISNRNTVTVNPSGQLYFRLRK